MSAVELLTAALAAVDAAAAATTGSGLTADELLALAKPSAELESKAGALSNFVNAELAAAETDQASAEEGVPLVSVLLPPVVQRVRRELAADPSVLQAQVKAAQCGGASTDVAEFFAQLAVKRGVRRGVRNGKLDLGGVLPPVGFEIHHDSRYPLRELSTGILVCEPLDFSMVGEMRHLVYHYTNAATVALIYDTPSVEVVGGWLAVRAIQPALFCTSATGSFNAKPAVYVAPRDPSQFADIEAIAANNYGSAKHRMEK
jgi:hypothetical protein